MSVAVADTTDLRGFSSVKRSVLRPLLAWDTDSCSSKVLEPGAVLAECTIIRNSSPGANAETYLIRFQSDGRDYTAPLFNFLPRTEIQDAVRPLPLDRIVVCLP